MTTDLSFYLKQLGKTASDLKGLIRTQSSDKIVLVGSAVALFGLAAYSFIKGTEKDDEDESGDKKDKALSEQDRRAPKKSRRHVLPQRKVFTEDSCFSDELTTSAPYDMRSSNRNIKGRFMSDFESSQAALSARWEDKDQSSVVAEEADDLYFAMMNKLNN